MSDDLSYWSDNAISSRRQSDQQDQDMAVRSNLMLNTDSDPAKAAAALPIAQKNAIPLQTVENNLPQFQNDEKWTVDSITDLRNNTPALYKFLAQPDAVRVAHPDIPVLQKIENVANDTMMGMASIVNAVGGKGGGQDSTTLALLRNKQMDGHNTPNDDAEAEAISQRIQAAQGGVMTASDPNMGIVGRSILGAAGMVPMGMEIAKKALIGGLGGAAVGAVVGGGTPAEFGTLPYGAAMGLKGGQVLSEYQIFSGQAYDQLLKVRDKNGNPLDPEVAKATARLVGIANAGLMHVSIGKLAKIIPGIGEMLEGDALKAALQSPQTSSKLIGMAKNYATSVGVMGAGMGAQTAVSEIGENVAKSLSSGDFEKKSVGEILHDTLEATGEGLGVGAVAGLPGLALHGAGVIVRSKGQPDPQAVTDYANNVEKLAKTAQMRQLSPELFRQYVAGVTKNGDFYMPSDQVIKLYQSIGPEDRAKIDRALPDFQNDMTEAALTNADVKMSQADWFAYLAPHADASYADHLKFEQDHVSLADVHDEEVMRGLMEDQMNGDGRTQQEVFHRRIMDQFENAGFTPDVARKYAELAAARFGAMMDKYGDNEAAARVGQALADELHIRQELPEHIQAAAKADQLDVLINKARNLKQGAPETRYPILSWLKKRGGIRSDSKEALDLRGMGISQKTMPGLFSKNKRGSAATMFKEKGLGLDNIPAHEFEAAFGTAHSEADDNGNVNRPWLMNAIENEYKMGILLDRKEVSPEEQFAEELARHDIDLEKSSNEQIKKQIQALLDSQNDQGKLYQSAFHGTPYHFDKFTLDHMGKGEGAQAYGWGLYFAGDKKVAEYYRETLADNKNKIIPDEVKAALKNLDNLGFETRGEALANIRAEKDKWREVWDANSPKDAEAADVIDAFIGREKDKGQTYEVDIPENHVLLDWDKPLSQQSPGVKSALEKLGIVADAEKVKAYDNALEDALTKEGNTKLPKTPDDPTGEEIYRRIIKQATYDRSKLEAKYGGDAWDRTDKLASMILHDAGVLGLKYFDGSSRKKGEGHHNYVIFDDSAIKIINRLYQNEQAVTRGHIQFEGDFRAVMTLTKDRNLTTTVHELAHWFAYTQRKLAAVDERAAADWDALKKHVGAEGQDSLTVEQEEKFARMFEAYTAEGKAPSVELQGAFNSFKAWMIRAYKLLMNPRQRAENDVAGALRAPLNDEVRDYFDRMIATEDQIDQVRSQPGFNMDEGLMKVLTKSEQEKYARLAEREDSMAKEKLFARALRQKEREATKAFKEEKARVLAETHASVMQSPVYRAMQFLRTGKFSEGDPQTAPDPFKLSRKQTVKMIGKDLADRLPGSFYGKDGAHPDFAAETFDYKSGQEMLLAMINAERPADVIERMAGEEMTARHGDMMKDGTLEREAVDQAMNDYRAQRLEMEGRAAAIRAKMPFPAGTNFKMAAKTLIGQRKAMEAGNSNRYYLATKRAAREFGKAVKGDDWAKAVEWKQKEMLNHFMYRESIKAREDVDRAAKQWRTLKRPDDYFYKKMDSNFLYLARAILSRHNFMTFRQDIGKYIENLQEYDPQGYEDVKLSLDENALDAKNWKDLTLDEFRALRDSVDNIIGVGRGQNDIMIAGQKVARDVLLTSLEEQIAKMKPSGIPTGLEETLTDMQKLKKGKYTALAMMTRVESWAKIMDGGDTGIFHDVFVRPIFEAKDTYTAKRNDILRKMHDIIAPQEDRLLNGGKIYVEELSYVFKNKAELLGMLLHTGNESNFDKLTRGRKWEEGMFRSAISRLEEEGSITKEDWDTVQALWHLTASLKPDAQRAFKGMFGRYFGEVTTWPVTTKYGEYEGGYWPAIVDRDINDDAAIRQDRENLVATNNTGVFPSTTLGPTKARNDAYAAPLSFDLNLLPQHMDKMLRITYLQPAVRDVAKIANHRRFRDAMGTIDPGITRNALIPYLWRTANQTTEIDSTGGIPGWKALNKMAGIFRRSAAGQVIMYNIPNGLQQLTGIGTSMDHVGARAMGEQFLKYRMDPSGYTAWMHEKSAFMNNRHSTISKEIERGIDNILSNKSKLSRTADRMNEHGYVFYELFQGFTDTMTWGTAFNNALEGKAPLKSRITGPMSEADAVRYADRVVRDTQGSAEPESLATYEAGPAFTKLFTMFSSFWNSQANYIGSELSVMSKDYKSKGGNARLWRLYLMALSIPAIGSRFIFDGMKSNLPGQDNKKKHDAATWATWLLGAQVQYVSGVVPVLGNIVNALWSHNVEKTYYNDSVFTSPVASAASKVVALPGETVAMLKGQKDPGSVIKDAMSSIGLISGFVPGMNAALPLGQLGKPVGFTANLVTGHAKVDGPVGLVQGMIIGPTKNNTK